MGELMKNKVMKLNVANKEDGELSVLPLHAYGVISYNEAFKDPLQIVTDKSLTNCDDILIPHKLRDKISHNFVTESRIPRKFINDEFD
ncbi:hypothetical protein Fmac_017877 [Flemingia macrophylla]|uniref:Uncharacterized protein n=1 Tax=Flemingia macrophylla TaxID=520843 RepID=A0ABD1M3F2_9FABA